MSEFQVQTRAVGGELRYFPTLKAAVGHAEADKDVWKISFDLPNGERVRLVRHWLDEEHSLFEYSDLMEEVKDVLAKAMYP